MPRQSEQNQLLPRFNHESALFFSSGTVSSDSCEIVELTGIGRVTALCLKINSRAQLTARQFWVQLGLFP